MRVRAIARRAGRAGAFALALVLIMALAGDGGAAQVFGYLGWVSNSKDGTVSVLDLTDFTVLDTFAVGKKPKGVTAWSDEPYALIALQGEAALVGVRWPEGMDWQMDVGKKPTDVALDSSGDWGLISLMGAASMQYIDENGVGATIAVGKKPAGVAIAPKGDLFAAACSGDGKAFLASYDEVLGRFARKSSFGVGRKPMDAAFDTEGKELAVTSLKDGTVTLIDTAGFQVTEVKQAGRGAWGVAYSPSTKSVMAVALSKRGRVALIVDEVTFEIAVGKKPIEIAFSPDGRLLLVANYKSDTVSVLDVGLRTVLATIPVGKGPYGVAVTARQDS